MFTQLESGFGLDVVVWLQAHGNPVFDLLAKILHSVGGNLSYLLILPLIYWSLDRQLGRRTFIVLIAILAAAAAVKLAVQAPRPDQVFPGQVTSLVEQDGYGLPSAHVAIAIAVWGFLLARLKRPRLWWALAVYVVVLGWSRMYAGVHYPQDVLAGGIVGLVVLWLCLGYIGAVARLWHSLKWTAQLAAVFLLGLVIVAFLFESEEGQMAAGLIFGGGLGAMLEERFVKFSAGGDTRHRILRYVTGIVFVGGVFFGLRLLFADLEPGYLFRIIRYSLVALFAFAAWPWLFMRLGLARPGKDIS